MYNQQSVLVIQTDLLDPVQPSKARSIEITGTESTWRDDFGAQVLAESTAALQNKSGLRQNAEKMEYTLACLKVRPRGKWDSARMLYPAVAYNDI